MKNQIQITKKPTKLRSFENLDEDVSIGDRVIHKGMECVVTKVGYKFLKVNKLLATVGVDFNYDEHTYHVRPEEVKYVVVD